MSAGSILREPVAPLGGKPVCCGSQTCFLIRRRSICDLLLKHFSEGVQEGLLGSSGSRALGFIWTGERSHLLLVASATSLDHHWRFLLLISDWPFKPWLVSLWWVCFRVDL